MSLSYPRYKAQLNDFLQSLPPDQPSTVTSLRELARQDLHFLATKILGRTDLDDEWHWQRAREIEAEPDSCIDLWARGSGKSSLITIALTLQDILKSHGEHASFDHEFAICILSFTRPAAKSFQRVLQLEAQQNEWLRSLFPDIFFTDPNRESPCWSLDLGLTVKRKTNRLEQTIESAGLSDGMPTGRHYDRIVVDDAVTLDSVRTTDSMQRTIEAWQMAHNLMSRGGRLRMVGTTYHRSDAYAHVMKVKALKPRIHRATLNGEVDGEPIPIFTKEELQQKRASMGAYSYNSQMLINPNLDSALSFRDEWFMRYKKMPDYESLPRVLVVDPANSRKKYSDFTAAWVVCLNEDGNYYCLDHVRDKLSLSERVNAIMDLHREWKPQGTFVEQYGLDATLEALKDAQETQCYRFTAEPLGGRMPKNDRILRLQPLFEQRKMWFPASLTKRDHEGKVVDVIQQVFEEEYVPFPLGTHDDSLDALSRIEDEEVKAKLQSPRNRYSKRERMRLTEEHCPPSPLTPGYADWVARYEKRSRYN